jgi:hypothetical protein
MSEKKEPKRIYKMYDGDVSMTRTERMSANYMPGVDREPNSFTVGITPCKIFSQSIEMSDAKMKMLDAWLKRVNE